ncbi:hypothetical protein, partial [Turicimonas muris]|uniref:hypothetical protein n=1 Tax=Turicimonas muris TaxID=1796652 RepID=UPI00248CDA9F
MDNLPSPNSVVLGTSFDIIDSQLTGKCIYLTKAPFHNSHPILDGNDVFHFLRTFDDSNFQFSKSRKSYKTIQSVKFTYEMTISSENQELFRIRHEKTATFFAIQILCKHGSMNFKPGTCTLNSRTRSVYIYSNAYVILIPDQNDPSPKHNEGIRNFSIFFNNKGVDKDTVNFSTSRIFYEGSPFNQITILRHKARAIDPDHTIAGVMKILGGHFFTFLHHSQISPKYLFGIFSWLSPFFKALTELPQFEEMKTIELDATFLVLHPYVICIPHLIYHNHGIPFGLMAAPTESASLYSLLFECLKAINP